MKDIRRMKLELQALQFKSEAINSELELVIVQHKFGLFDNNSDFYVEMKLKELVCERNKLDAAMAEKQLELFDLQGGVVS